MARKISAHTTEAPGSTSDLIGNIGSTTRRFTAQQILSIPITAQGDILFGDSSANTTRLAAPTSGAVLQYSSGSSAPAWVTVTSGGVFIGAAAGTPTFLVPPTSGAVLTFSSASSIPAWSVPTSGAVLIASSVSVPTWRALGTSGQVLQSTGGSPAWVDSNTLTGTLTTVGTSGQLLQTTGGAASWVGIAAGGLLYGNTSGEVTVRTIGSSGQFLQSTGGVPAWVADPSTGHITTAGTSGQILQTTGGVAAWVGSTTVPSATPSSITEISWRLSNDTTQAVSTVAPGSLNFNVERWDTDGVHSTAAASSLVTIQTGGTYYIGGNLIFSSGTANDVTISILMNSTTVIAAQTARLNLTQPIHSLNVGCVYQLSSGNTLELQAMITSVFTDLTTAGNGAQEFWGIKIS